jgi:hypothetical protein
MTSRHAIRSALVGSRREQADFGLDAETFVQSPLLPHCAPMGDLANLVCLYGLQLQSEERWKQAADAYLAALRMGRHMTHQTTLAEAVVGARMLEAGFYGLSLWAAQCPDANLAGETLAAFEKLSEDMFHLEAVMTSELKLRTYRQEELVKQFPDGPWAEMLLDVLEVDPADDDPESVRDAAVAAARGRGVPPDVFRDRAALVGYVTKLQSLYAEYTKAVLDAVALDSTREQIVRAAQINEQFAPRFQEFGSPAEIDAGKIVAFLASHRAERTMTRTVLAIAAARTAAGFPETLNDVAGRLGGSVPVSPYDGSPLVYAPSQDRRAYVLTIPEVTIGETVLPKIEFKSAGESAP